MLNSKNSLLNAWMPKKLSPSRMPPTPPLQTDQLLLLTMKKYGNSCSTSAPKGVSFAKVSG
jgi:hypothetical protein